jgi:hypothetical protein
MKTHTLIAACLFACSLTGCTGDLTKATAANKEFVYEFEKAVGHYDKEKVWDRHKKDLIKKNKVAFSRPTQLVTRLIADREQRAHDDSYLRVYNELGNTDARMQKELSEGVHGKL